MKKLLIILLGAFAVSCGDGSNRSADTNAGKTEQSEDGYADETMGSDTTMTTDDMNNNNATGVGAQGATTTGEGANGSSGAGTGTSGTGTGTGTSGTGTGTGTSGTGTGTGTTGSDQ